MGYVVLNNTTGHWLAALGVAVAVTLALELLKSLVVRHLGAIAARTETKLDDIAVAALESTRLLVLAILGLYAGTAMLELAPAVRLVVTRTAVVTGLVQAAIWGNSMLRAWLTEYYQNRADDPGRATSAAAVGFIARMVLWIVILLMILENLGVNITALVASLGIGGIAVALAVQNILGDLFASLSIVLDKPFVIGDFIIVDKYLGAIEHVGLKTTRIRAQSGEQLVFSNADLLKSRIQNMARMTRRRAVFSIGVTYDTPTTKLRMIPPMLTEIVQSQAPVTFDRAHFSGMTASALNFEVVYWVETADYIRFMDIQQEIFLQAIDRLKEHDIEFAFPTQTLYLKNEGEDAARLAGTAAPAQTAESQPG
jgi:small-conductance mechanosensitive channel